MLKKINLMPFARSEEIRKRFGIPAGIISATRRRIGRPNKTGLALELVKRFEQDPALKPLLSTRSLWKVAIISQMARDHTAKEIHAALVTAAKKRNEVEPVPTVAAITQMMRSSKMRTSEEAQAIRLRKNSTRKKNNLAVAEKASLHWWAVEFYQNRKMSPKKKFREELLNWFIASAVKDVDFIQLTKGMDQAKMRATWFAYLAKATRFYELKFFNKRKQREKEHARAEGNRALDVFEMKMGFRFSKNERTILLLTQLGAPDEKIAKRLRISLEKLREAREALAKKAQLSRSA